MSSSPDPLRLSVVYQRDQEGWTTAAIAAVTHTDRPPRRDRLDCSSDLAGPARPRRFSGASGHRELGLRHLFIEPYQPRTQGSGRALIRTLTERSA
jgi:hypothetical protein